MNEAAILAAKKNEKKISMATIEESVTKVIVGVAKKSRVISEKERRLTAYHEGGHAICAHMLEHVSPVHQVTIIPRGMAGGFTMQLPVEDKYFATKREMEENIIVMLGGRVAEELVLKDISTGASNDLERVSKTARDMVKKYGMSANMGPITFENEGEVFLGNSLSSGKSYSEKVAYEIDEEVRNIINGAYHMTKKILAENMDKLENVAQALLVYETLDAEQFEKAVEGKLPLERDDEEKSESAPKEETAVVKVSEDEAVEKSEVSSEPEKAEEEPAGKVNLDKHDKSDVLEKISEIKEDVDNEK